MKVIVIKLVFDEVFHNTPFYIDMKMIMRNIFFVNSFTIAKSTLFVFGFLCLYGVPTPSKSPSCATTPDDSMLITKPVAVRMTPDVRIVGNTAFVAAAIAS